MLGHIQRGGAPSARDRYLGTRFGVAAIEQLKQGNCGVMVGLLEGEIVATPLAEVCAGARGIDQEYLGLAQMLAR
jgi:6-phosphofructokinase 1